MKTAIILGAGGLVGNHLVKFLLADSRYGKVVVLLRKKIDLIHVKLQQHIFDFDNPDKNLLVADEMFCCLGTTIKSAGSKAAFYKVDHDYVINIAEQGFLNGIKKFAIVSSMGANEKSGVFYNSTKGKTENDLKKIGFEQLIILRPSLLLGHRSEFRFGETVAKLLLVNLSFIIPKKYRPIKGSQVAQALISSMNANEKGIHIIESDIASTL